MTLWYKREDKS